jgi:hypothetical protein
MGCRYGSYGVDVTRLVAHRHHRSSWFVKTPRHRQNAFDLPINSNHPRIRGMVGTQTQLSNRCIKSGSEVCFDPAPFQTAFSNSLQQQPSATASREKSPTACRSRFPRFLDDVNIRALLQVHSCIAFCVIFQQISRLIYLLMKLWLLTVFTLSFVSKVFHPDHPGSFASVS